MLGRYEGILYSPIREESIMKRMSRADMERRRSDMQESLYEALPPEVAWSGSTLCYRERTDRRYWSLAFEGREATPRERYALRRLGFRWRGERWEAEDAHRS